AEARNAYAGDPAWRARVSEVSVVIPTMNEEASIGRVIDEVRKALGPRLSEILVVDTDSRDRTREIASAKGARVIPEPRRGYGRAYKTGFDEARGTYIATLDADLTYPADRLPDFLAALETDRADFVSGDRMSHLGGEAMSGMHRIGNAILNAAFRLLYRARIRDSHSGMWAFRASIRPRLKPVHVAVEGFVETRIQVRREELPGLPVLHRFPDPPALEVDVVRPVVLPCDPDRAELHRELVHEPREQDRLLPRHRELLPLPQPRRVLNAEGRESFRRGERGVRLVHRQEEDALPEVDAP